MNEKRLLVSLYDGCQYRCGFCMYGYVKEAQPLSRKETMTEEQWHTVIAQAFEKGFRVLEVGGRGEPTLNPAFTRIIKKARALGFEIELLSNALQDKEIIEILPCLRQLTVNLNAVDEQGLHKIHSPYPGFNFDRCSALVKNVVSAISEKNLGINLRTNYVVTKQSVKDAFSFPLKVRRLLGSALSEQRCFYVSYQYVYNYIKTPSNLGFDLHGLKKVLLWARINRQHKFLLDHTNILDFIQKTEKLIERLNRLSDGPAQSDASSQTCHYTCQVHRQVLFIDGNGDCYGCYNPYRAVNGLDIAQDPFYFGNLMSQDFGEIAAERKDFEPILDVSKSWWRPCLLCKAAETGL